MAKTLKTIASLKAIRGSMAFTIGAGLIWAPTTKDQFIWEDYPALVELQSSSAFKTAINWIISFTNEQIIAIGILAFSLGILRWVEAVGIWINKSWAEWLAILTGVIYIPFEINELLFRFTWLMLLILFMNILIVTYLMWVLHLKRQKDIGLI